MSYYAHACQIVFQGEESNGLQVHELLDGKPRCNLQLRDWRGFPATLHRRDGDLVTCLNCERSYNAKRRL